MLQVDREHAAVYWEAISGELCFESFEFAVRESIKRDERFPKVARLLELGRSWRRPVAQDLTRPALGYTPPELAAEKMAALLRACETGDFSGLTCE